MTSTFERARYALWHHESQQMPASEPEWRETPRSKQYVGVIPSVTLPGTVIVQRAGPRYIDVALTSEQSEHISTWLASLPSSVMQSTAQLDGVIQHTGAYVCLTPQYRATEQWPTCNDSVRVRVTAAVSTIGPLRKANIIITDVLLADADITA